MATNFDNNALSSSGGFKPSTKDTPIDIRSRVETENDILEIPNPYVGMIVFVKDTGKRYEVLTIKDVQQGLSKVSRVDTYKEFAVGGSQAVDLSPYAKTAYVDEKVDNLVIPKKVSDLTNDVNYATETHVANAIANAQLGGDQGEINLNGLVAKNEVGNASQILFNDGESFQTKLDAGVLKGEKGEQGIQGEKGEQGPKGDQGEQGPKGEDGLTTSIAVNGSTFVHQNGVITLPDYHTKEEVDSIIQDYTGGKKQVYLTQAEYDSLAENEKNDDSIVWNITDTEEYAIPADLSFDGNTLFLQDKDGNNIGEGVLLERSSATAVLLTSPNGTLFELKVSDTGEVSAVEYEGVSCASISINKSTVSMFQEDTVQLTATVLPDDCIRPVIWSASNSNCIVNNGLVTAVSVGDCVITAQCGDKTATCNITVNEKINVDEPGLTAYYLASAHGDDNTIWQDLTGNNNHATVTGTGIEWKDDMMKITDVDTYVTFPFAPMNDTTNNFRIEVEYSNNNIEDYKRVQLLNCIEEVRYLGGIVIAASAGTTNENISCRIGGVEFSVSREVAEAESFKVKLEHKNDKVYIYINDELVKEGKCNNIPSDINLSIGLGEVNVKYVKYYTNI